MVEMKVGLGVLATLLLVTHNAGVANTTSTRRSRSLNEEGGG